VQAKDAVGRYGEKLAARHLTGLGYELLDRNWRGAAGEIDLVVRDGGTVVVVEVKTRQGLGFGHPAEAVTRAKLGRLRRLAGEWLHAHPGARDVRIDVVAVVLPRSGAARLEHLVGVS
jgi:putative endonuclease